MDHQSITLPIPSVLENEFFFEGNTIELAKSFAFLPENFYYEIFYYNGLECFKPWEQPTDAAPQLIDEWGTVKTESEELFRCRELKKTLKGMKKGIGLFLQLLFWSNDQPVILKAPILFDQLAFKPINIKERLSFILSRPNSFHSFRQLSELMNEQEKLFAKKTIKKKASQPNG